MPPQSLPDVKTIFGRALELEDADRRTAYLDEVCADAPAVRAEVEELLGMHVRASGFLRRPAASMANLTADYAPVTERPGTVIGHYKLMEQIGEGGFGLVFVAEQTKPVQRKVALKVIKPGMDSKQVIARFEAELQALALMDHPNIARVLDAGTTESGRPFFVMELVRGIPITEYCDKNQLTPNERLELFVSVCHAIQHAHQKGIIHRDVKPSNVLVTSHDGKPVAKVIDFGVAKAIHQHLTDKSIYTNFAQMIGTPLYMSPEQAEMSGLDIDTRSDIYSLGVLLYELLTGSTPLEKKRFAKVAYDEMRRLIREEEPPRPSQRLSTCDTLPSLAANRKTEPAKLSRMFKGELDWVVMKALEKDRTRRYETANGLARDIQRYLADEVVEARPPSTGYRLRKFASKNRAALSTAATLLVILISAFAFSTYQATRALISEQKARVAMVEAVAAQLAEKERAEGEYQAKERAEIAEKEATANAIRAIEERKISDAISRFFQNDILRQADTHYQQLDRFREVIPNLTVRQALDRASDRIEERFHSQPSLERSVRIAIAEAYLGVGDANQAIQHLERCQSLHAVRPDTPYPEEFHVRRLLASAYLAAGRGRDARKLCEKTLPLVRGRHGHTHDETLRFMNILGLAYTHTHATAKAVELFEELRRLDDARPAKSRSDFAVWNNLAIAYEDAGRLTDALQLHEQCLEQRRNALGPNHLDTLMSMNNLGTLYWKTGKLDRSIPLFKEASRLRKVKLGADHPLTIRTLTNLGVNYRAAGRLQDAIAVLEEAVGLGRHHPSAESVRLDQISNELAEAYTDAQEHTKAEPLFRSILDSVHRQSGPQSLAAASWSARLGLNLLNQKRWCEAEESIRASLNGRESQQPNSWATFNTYSLLGGALLGQKKYDDAEPLLLKGFQGMKERESKIPKEAIVRLTESIDRLIELYTAMNKLDEVKRWEAERRKCQLMKK